MGIWLQAEWIGFGLSVAGCILCAGMTRIVLPPFRRMLQTAGWVRPNYKGDLIPVGSGAAMLLVFVAVAILMILAEKMIQVIPAELHLDIELGAILILSFGMAFLGLLDDMAGSRETGGLKGHLQKWVRDGELTTGFIKAVGGIILALGVVVSGISFDQFERNSILVFSILVDTLVITLMANWINLLDVRPGRALKGVLLKAGALLFFVPPELSVPLMMLAGVVVSYFPADLRAEVMMGDVGANFLGAVLGYLVVNVFDLGVTTLILTILVLLHIYTESRSMTKLIESNKWLTWFDELGREEARE